MFHEYIAAIIMGIVEGLTEFLPVSSTGHMIMTAELIGFTGEKVKTFEIVIQLGSIMAVVVVFWQKLLSLFYLDGSKMDLKAKKLNLIHVGLAMAPAVVIGLALHSLIKKHLFGPETVLIGLIVGGILMIVAEKWRRPVTAPTIDDLSYGQAFAIGLFQCLALWPGFSRSGSTMSGGLLVGTNHKVAAEFTFIVAVPMMVAASGLDLYKSLEFISTSDIPMFAIGFVTAFIVALLAIKTFLSFVSRVKLTYFAIYRFAIAILFYWFVL